jgi:serine/threonine protein kinase
MEYLELGDLQRYLNERPPLSEKDAGQIASQVVEGLSFMHQNRYAHRDLKPAVRSLAGHKSSS